MRVVIEIGHEDVHPGATRDGVREVDLNQTLAQALGVLGDDDITYEIWQRPTTDDGLEVVRRALEEDPPDLVVSLHHNAVEDQTAHGTILFYNPEHAQSGQVVSYIQREAQRLGGGFAGLGESVHSSGRGNSPGNRYPLRRSGRYGAVLVEVGFMSNPDNLEQMQTEQFRTEAAAQLHGAIRQFGVAAGLLAADAPSPSAGTPLTIGRVGPVARREAAYPSATCALRRALAAPRSPSPALRRSPSRSPSPTGPQAAPVPSAIRRVPGVAYLSATCGARDALAAPGLPSAASRRSSSPSPPPPALAGEAGRRSPVCSAADGHDRLCSTPL